MPIIKTPASIAQYCGYGDFSLKMLIRSRPDLAHFARENNSLGWTNFSNNIIIKT